VTGSELLKALLDVAPWLSPSILLGYAYQRGWWVSGREYTALRIDRDYYRTKAEEAQLALTELLLRREREHGGGHAA
jgi:hypothetical protein